MARLGTYGAELGSAIFEGLTSSGSTLSIASDVVRTGARSYKTAWNGLAAYFAAGVSGVLGRSYFFRGYFRISALPSTSLDVLWATAGGVQIAGIRALADGSLRVYSGAATTQVTTAPGTITPGTWYRAELRVKTDSGAVDQVEFRLDGTTLVAATGLTIIDAAPSSFRFGMPLGTGVTNGDSVWWDDIAVNDDQDADQSTWPGVGEVRLLKPVADAARAAGWLNGAAGATNLWDALDNMPPAGTFTTSITATTQIRNAVADATQDYDATLQSYNAAGVSPVDAITVARVVAAFMRSTGSGVSDTASVAGVSNPAVAEVVSAPLTGVGTFPTTWTLVRTQPTYEPSVVRGTGPVVRVGKRAAVTDSVDCCLLGLLVDSGPIPPRPQTVNADSVASAEAFGSATVTPGPVTAVPASIASEEAVGQPAVTGGAPAGGSTVMLL